MSHPNTPTFYSNTLKYKHTKININNVNITITNN